MTRVRLPNQWIERLVRLPESGMGYQRVNITLKNGKVLHDVVILNAEEAQAPEPFEQHEILNVELAH